MRASAGNAESTKLTRPLSEFITLQTEDREQPSDAVSGVCGACSSHMVSLPPQDAVNRT